MPINYLKKIQLGEFNEDGYRIAPSKEVSSIIEGFYVFSRDPKNDTHLIFNDGFPVIVFLQTLDDTVTVINGRNTYEIKAAWVSAGSIKNVYVKYNSNTKKVFIVRFYPGTCYQLFGLKSPYFRSNPLVMFEQIARNNNINLEEFFSLGSTEDKISLIETYIRLAVKKTNAPVILQQTLEYIHQSKGNNTVRNISNDAGVNYKWLERCFIKNVGLLPKEYIQLQRFINAYLDLVGTKDIDLMRTAVANGYYDSNHFLKDFKTYTGKTPLAYMKLFI